MKQKPRRKVQFVIKSSKLCNLRCRYCYEYAELHRREHISPEQLEQMYTNIASYYSKYHPLTDIEFDWHGGEPLLLPPDFYWRTFALQQRIFDNVYDFSGRVINVVQTNLTILNEEIVHLLSEGFDRVGVSIDLWGGLRVNGSGIDSQLKVLANMDRLREKNIDFGCITVLTKLNLPYIAKIYKFYETLKISSFRLLPLFNGAFAEQHQGYEITPEEVVAAFKTLFELVLNSESSMKVEPISRYIQQIIHYCTPHAEPGFYDKSNWESIYVVNLNGDVFSYGDAYNPEFCHGNLFTTPLKDIIHSPGHQKALAASQKRLDATCKPCKFYGSCDGYPVAEESLLHNRIDKNGKVSCPVEQEMLAYVEGRLKELGIINPISAQLNFPGLNYSGERKNAQTRPQHQRLFQQQATNYNRQKRATTITPFSRSNPLQQGIQVYFAEADTNPHNPRIMLSSGMTKNLDELPNSSQYIDAAIIPQEPWRVPTREEYELLCPSEPLSNIGQWNLGSNIGIVSLPDRIIEPIVVILEEYGTRETLEADNYIIHTKHPNWNNSLDRLVDYLWNYCLYNDAPQPLSLYTALPGLKTVTRKDLGGPFERSYVGLHLDSWEKAPLKQRHKSKNRICLNLGREDRFFLFINLTLIDMFRAMGLSEPDDIYKNYRGLHLGHKFMNRYPDYPVVKLRLAPGEAYIAPTENVIHDATSLNKQYPDICLHFTGYFGMTSSSSYLTPNENHQSLQHLVF